MGTEDDRKEVKVGVALKQSVKEELVKLLQEYLDVFAWLYQDMPRLNTDIVVHKLPLTLECPPIKKKLRRTQLDMVIKILEEVDSSLMQVSWMLQHTFNGFLILCQFQRKMAKYEYV